MSKALEQFEEMYDLINEISGNYPPASGAIAATSDPARKDFGPASGGNGYPVSQNKGILDPYQSHPDSTSPDPVRPAHLPYPLETVNDFLADSVIHLTAALNQMRMATDPGSVIDPVFRSEIKKLRAEGLHALNIIKKIGKKLEIPANLNY